METHEQLAEIQNDQSTSLPPALRALVSPTGSMASLDGPEKERKAWRKLITMVYDDVCNHKHAHIFMSPVRSPNYQQMVLHPTDLGTIKSKLRDG